MPLPLSSDQFGAGLAEALSLAQGLRERIDAQAGGAALKHQELHHALEIQRRDQSKVAEDLAKLAGEVKRISDAVEALKHQRSEDAPALDLARGLYQKLQSVLIAAILGGAIIQTALPLLVQALQRGSAP